MFLEWLISSFGYVGIFIIGFISSSLFPLGSEVFVIFMVNKGYDIWLILLFVTTGNYLGALSNYYIGKYGDKFFLSRYIKTDKKKKSKAHDLFERYGTPILFFSWVPVIGDPLCVIPGILNVSVKKFSFWVILGKIFRYMIIIFSTKAIVGL